jgi:hypothetical protein
MALASVYDWLPRGEPWAWHVFEEEGVVGHLCIREGKVHYHWTVSDNREHRPRVFQPESPAVALGDYANGTVLILCADLSRYLFTEMMQELLALRDPARWCDINDYDGYTTSGFPPVPAKLTAEASNAYVRGGI